MDTFLKEIGVPMAVRLMAKGLKPRVVISENDGIWTLRAETSLRTKSVTFTPDVEFEEKTADGRDIKVDLYLTVVFLSLTSRNIFSDNRPLQQWRVGTYDAGQRWKRVHGHSFR